MKKMGNKGFMLVETLIVSVFVMTTLIFVFIQFQKLDSSYKKTLKYNTTDGLYAVYNVREYILNNGFSTMTTNFATLDNPYIDLSNCPSAHLTNTQYCSVLLTKLKIKTIILVEDNPNELIVNLPNITIISEDMKDFIRYIDFDSAALEYRLIVEFNDGTFASLKIYEGI